MTYCRVLHEQDNKDPSDLLHISLCSLNGTGLAATRCCAKALVLGRCSTPAWTILILKVEGCGNPCTAGDIFSLAERDLLHRILHEQDNKDPSLSLPFSLKKTVTLNKCIQLLSPSLPPLSLSLIPPSRLGHLPHKNIRTSI